MSLLFIFCLKRSQTSLNLLLKRSKEPPNFDRRRGPKSLLILFRDAKRASKMKTKESQHIISRDQKNLKEEDQRVSPY
jgi:hypothetical protein